MRKENKSEHGMKLIFAIVDTNLWGIVVPSNDRINRIMHIEICSFVRSFVHVLFAINAIFYSSIIRFIKRRGDLKETTGLLLSQVSSVEKQVLI